MKTNRAVPLAPMVDALTNLRHVLKRMHVLPPGEGLTVTLSHDAGKAFQLWLMQNVSLNVGKSLGPLRTIDGVVPRREVDIEGMTVAWPLTLVALGDGRIVPEPVAHIRTEDLMRVPLGTVRVTP